MIIVFLLFIIAIVFVIFKTMITVKPNKVIILEKDGKVYKVLFPGKHFINPFVHKVKQIQWSKLEKNEKGYTVPVKSVVTELPLDEISEELFLAFVSDENFKIKINMTINYIISNHIEAAYKTDDCPDFIIKLIQNILIDTLGKIANGYKVDNDEISRHLFYALERNLPKIGIKILKIDNFQMEEVN